jgi:hypothetical protein
VQNVVPTLRGIIVPRLDRLVEGARRASIPLNKPGHVALGIISLGPLAAFIATHLGAELVEKGNATALHFRFLPKCLADLASIARDDPTMRTVAVIFALALITIAFEIYSDAVLTRSEFSRPAPDPATTAVANALNTDRLERRP